MAQVPTPPYGCTKRDWKLRAPWRVSSSDGVPEDTLEVPIREHVFFLGGGIEL